MEISDIAVLRVAELTERMAHQQALVAKLEEELKREAATLFRIETVELPELLDEYNVDELKLKSGERVSVAPFYSAHISKEHETEAHEWLHAHNLGALIKTRVSEGVHSSTLKAWVKEMYETGALDVPTELFGVFVGRKAKLDKPKVKR